MKLELLYFDGCPNWQIAAERLETVAARRGLVVERRAITGPDEAAAAGFTGSPTVLVDGRDPFASGDETVGLSCRLYATPDGPAGSPTVEQLEGVLDADAATGSSLALRPSGATL
ncbi:MAG TPA: thioredoxin family protein [Acidimicrobiales bacterium]|nr:thioredoxin family protein [Acidimicrobiales bacterium]